MSNPKMAGGGRSGENPNVQLLLDALANSGDGSAILQSIMDSSAPPAASLIAGLLMNEATGSDRPDFVDDENADEIERLLAIAETESFVDEDNGGEDDEFEALREVNDTVAAALGACPECWGGDPECKTCAGQGASGAMDPDEQLFSELILPAVRRVRANRRTRKPVAQVTEQSTD